MAKVKDPEVDRDPMINVLVESLKAPNTYSAQGIEIARLDAAEAILKFARPDETWAVELAKQFLHLAALGKNVNVGAAGKVRAATLVLEHERPAPKESK